MKPKENLITKPPNVIDCLVSSFKVGNLSHLQSRGTDWPIGCSESESKSGLTSGCPVRKGGPVAPIKVALIEKRGGIHIYWSRWQNNSLPRSCFPTGRMKVHTA